MIESTNKAIKKSTNRKNSLEGIIKRHPDGFGFLIPDDREHPDVYMPKHTMRGVMSGDKVKITVLPEKGGDRFRGEMEAILQRSNTKVIGRLTLKSKDSEGLLLDESKGWGENLKIPVGLTGLAKNGDFVTVEILSWPSEKTEFTGKVIEILGDIQDPLNDVKRVLVNQKIPNEWNSKIEKESKIFPEKVSEKDWQGRKDLRHLSFVTIDGATAKDFDDAIFVETAKDGFHLKVAIADVSHYVKIGSAIDSEAYLRGTSVYFPNFVVPMLPEVLSNNLCSLMPHVPRLAMVADMKISFSGELENAHFYEAVILSQARITYGEAQEVIDGNEVPNLVHVKDMLLRSADLAKLLMARRFRDGSLDLEIPETEIVLNAAGAPTDIIKSERLFSHRLIEEMMLIANVAVAQYISSAEAPSLYRVHDKPNPEAIQTLEKYLWNFGGKQRISGGKLQKKLTKALEFFSGKPEAQILNILTLRSMAQAKYDGNNIGHFGLGFEHYTHFTSPIRRYPDLMVHRVLKALSHPNKGYYLMAQDEVQTAGNMLSACEQRSVKAERQFISIKKARFMNQFLGQEFDGVISGVAKFGVFVLLRNYDIDGLVKLEKLGRNLVFDEENLTLRGRKSGQTVSIGDPIRVKVVSTNVEMGQIDFDPAVSVSENETETDQGTNLETYGEVNSERTANRDKNWQDNKKRSSPKDNSERFRQARVSQPGRKNKTRSLRSGKNNKRRSK